ncbi:hypothetical protein N7468_007383 [Penicillium chermesinum]|uniref:Zn(2)-C6 fungal-type domain-containing protein n=1 Tax=Penicillium chermesinum TaxID=63820 RepID=A0A9W9TKL6_9EURO|nr:uncharacterized protein N7468_007383 [Penicillium chermesinum]KAJ5226158.1 hypothetical protein N7468_007383 [Penicillium chermesinum]
MISFRHTHSTAALVSPTSKRSRASLSSQNAFDNAFQLPSGETSFTTEYDRPSFEVATSASYSHLALGCKNQYTIHSLDGWIEYPEELPRLSPEQYLESQQYDLATISRFCLPSIETPTTTNLIASTEHPERRACSPYYWDFPETINSMRRAIQGEEPSSSEQIEHPGSKRNYMDLTFILEKPSEKPSPPERQKRSRLEIDRQKRSIAKLKEFGGACLWCYRSKKRCGPEDICSQCSSSRRTCVRNPAQVRLYIPPEESRRTGVHLTGGPPTREAYEILHGLMIDAFHKSGIGAVKVHFRPQGASLGDNIWAFEGPRPYHNPSELRIRQVVDQFSSAIRQYIHSPALSELEHNYSLSLFQEAIKMAKLFQVIQSLATCRVYVDPCSLQHTQAVLFLITVSCCQYMAEISEGFSTELFEALRRKDVYDTYSKAEQHKLNGLKLFNPIWITTALYYRVIKGLLDLQSNLVIAQVFDSLDSHLVNIGNCLWCMLKHVPCQKEGDEKMTTRQAVDSQIPALESNPPRSCDFLDTK